MGKRRARSAHQHPDCEVTVIVDLDESRARSLGDEIGSEFSTRWNEVVESSDVDAVVVATPHRDIPDIAAPAAAAGKHLFCEKPMGRNAQEAQRIVEAARASSVEVVVGYTLRHHSGIQRAHALVRESAIGNPLLMRGRYGHGGRPDYEQEWRGDPELAGGGELLDQGAHLVDLSRWFLGDLEEVTAMVATLAWKVEPLEDNGFLLARAREGGIAMLHASWTQWKNLFSLEVFGTEGYVTVEGLGGSYGPQSVTIGRRTESGGPPEVEEVAIEASDPWRNEWAAFVDRMKGHDCDSASGEDGLQTLRVVDAAYRAAREGRVATLD